MPATPNSFISPQSVRAATAVTTALETNYHAPGAGAVKLATFGPNGGRVTRLRSRPRANVSATALHLYLSTDAGVTKTLIDSALVNAHNPANNMKIPETDWLYSDVNPLIGPANGELWISQAIALPNGIAHEIEWGDF